MIVWRRQSHVTYGIHEDANLFTSTSDLFAEVSQRLQQENIHCVLVDEAQFLTKQQVYQLSDVVDKLKIPVLVWLTHRLPSRAI